MFLTFLKQSLRSIFRNKLYSIINFIGFGLGISVTSILVLFLISELNYDSFHEDGDQILRVIQENNMDANTKWTVPYVAGCFGPAMKNEYTEVEYSSRMYYRGGKVVKHEETKFIEDYIFAVDPDFLKMFSYPLISGDVESCLNEPQQIVITESAAKKYFGDENPLGKNLFIDQSEPFKITGIVQDPPKNSHIYFDFLLSYKTIETDPNWAWLDTWYTALVTYIKVKPGTDSEKLAEDLLPLIHKLQPDQPDMIFTLQAIPDIHLGSSHVQYDYNMHPSSYAYIYGISAIVVAIIFMACFNFINLASARALRRFREVGMRKTIGATRGQLVWQFILETLLLVFLTMIPALILVELVLPMFNQFMETNLSVFDNFIYILAILGLTLVVGIFSGTYPAMLMSRFTPISALSGLYTTGKKGSAVRTTLIISQFTVTIILIVSLLLVRNQINYLDEYPLGFEKENVLFVHLFDEGESRSFEDFRKSFESIPGVLATSGSQVIPGRTAQDHVFPDGYEAEDPWTINMNLIDDGYMETMGIEVLEGRGFDASRPSDVRSIVINEKALKDFGWDTWEGKALKQSHSGKDFNVIGLIKDYNFLSLHTPIEPQMLVYYPKRSEYISMKLDGNNLHETIKLIESKWSETFPEKQFNYEFLDDYLQKWYTTEDHMSKIVGTFSMIALFIACLGVFGLASFAIERKTKEIGIRKVLGSNTFQIVNLFTRSFIAITVVANIIAWPIAYYFIKGWLENFAYRDSISIVLFPLAGLLVFVIVFITVGTKAWLAAGMNPVLSLRDE